MSSGCHHQGKGCVVYGAGLWLLSSAMWPGEAANVTTASGLFLTFRTEHTSTTTLPKTPPLLPHTPEPTVMREGVTSAPTAWTHTRDLKTNR